MFSAAFALLSLRLRGIGLLVLAAALPVAWARIFSASISRWICWARR